MHVAVALYFNFFGSFGEEMQEKKVICKGQTDHPVALYS